MFVSSFTALVLFALFRHLGFHAWAGNTVPQLSALLLIVLLTTAAVLLIGRRLTAASAAALASGILLCVIYPHRAILDDPISALLGFSGIGAVLFGLIWRVLTEGDITQEDAAVAGAGAGAALLWQRPARRHLRRVRRAHSQQRRQPRRRDVRRGRRPPARHTAVRHRRPRLPGDRLVRPPAVAE